MAFVAQELVGNSIGPYEIINVIGEGGMGIVYKGVHRTLDQEVAIKALSASLSVNTEMRDRFLQEARIQAKLTHPNIVNLLNFIEDADSFYLIMGFIEGETLEALIKRVGLIPPERAVDISVQVLGALQFAHDKGVIHRDIKPSNIMISTSGLVKIMDFGIARIMGSKRQTATGVRPGTLWYMSPEQVKGQEIDARSDIYSFGVTLYQVVTGKVPFDADSDYGIMRAHVELEPISPREAYPHIPEYLENAVLKSLAKDPGNRFQSAREMADGLQGEKTMPRPRMRHAANISAPEFSLWDTMLAGIVSYRVQIGLLAATLLLIILFVNIAKDGKDIRQPGTDTQVRGSDIPLEKPEPVAPPPTEIPGSKDAGRGSELKKPVDDLNEGLKTVPKPPPPPPPPDPPRRLSAEDLRRIRNSIQEANNLWGKGQYEEADSEIRKALSLDPGNREAIELQRKIAAARKTENM